MRASVRVADVEHSDVEVTGQTIKGELRVVLPSGERWVPPEWVLRTEGDLEKK